MADEIYNSIFPLLSNLVNDLLVDKNGPLRYIDNCIYSKVDGYQVRFEHPDITGYTYIFMQPPHLSGYGLSEDYGGTFGEHCKFLVFAGVDFTPPAAQLVASELPARTGSLPFGTEFSSSGQVSMSYFDNQDNDVFLFHKVWINYIQDVLRGIDIEGNPIGPTKEYWAEPNNPNSRFGQIDYATSLWVLKTKPVMKIDDTSAINYVGKAVGVFPLVIPDKEVIGRRDSNELTLLPYTYTCSHYLQCATQSYNRGQIQDHHFGLLKEFYQYVLTYYA